MNYFKNILLIIIPVTLLLSVTSCKKQRCSDGKLNQNEEQIDCGGPCEACPTCSDGILNNEETEIDCGGPNCNECPPKWYKMNSGTSENLNAVARYNNTLVTVGNTGTILKSTDGGENWSALSSPVSVNLNEVQLLSETNIFIVGEDDNVLISSDGSSFSVSKTGENSGWKDLHFLHPDTGVVGGHPTRICFTNDGGKTWRTPFERAGASSGIDAISFFNGKVGYAVGGFRYLETLDGGSFWSDLGTGANEADFNDFDDLHYMALNRIFMTRKDGVYFSTDGIEWINKVLKCSGGKFDFDDKLGLYAGANLEESNGRALFSDDNGVRWTEINGVSTANIFTDGEIITATNLLLVGEGGVIYKRK